MTTPLSHPPNDDWSPFTKTLETEKNKRRNRLIQSWFRLTSIEEVPLTASFEKREKSRQSNMTSSVLFFFLVMVIVLLPACWIGGYTNYFWLDLGLAVATILGLALNRSGHAISAGIIVTFTSFSALTVALFLTIPFTELTLQGYDMYVIVELLAVALLPARTVFLIAIAGIIAIVGTLLYIPHTSAFAFDISTSLPIILMRPIGTLFLVAGVAFIISERMKTAIKRAGQAEAIAKLEHDIAEQNRDLEQGVNLILQTHVAVANGDLTARAPLEQHHKLWQIAVALNTLLVRHQRAVKAEQQLQHIDYVINSFVRHVQQAESENRNPTLQPTGTPLDRLLAALQGKTIERFQLSQNSPIRQTVQNPRNANNPFGITRYTNPPRSLD